MNEKLRMRCDLFAENRQLMRKHNHFENSLYHILCALLFSVKEKKVDPDTFRKCKRLLKKEKGFFSEFRGFAKMIVISKMAMSEDPKKTLDDLTYIYVSMKEIHWIGNLSRIMTALILYDSVTMEQIPSAVLRTEEIYKKMRQSHPLITSGFDVPYAALLTISGRNEDVIFEDMEACFDILKKKFILNRDMVQSLSQVIAVSEGDPELKSQRIYDIFKGLKKAHHRFMQGPELPILGAFAAVPLSVEQTVEMISETDDYLKQKKGFGCFSLSRTQRRMFSAALVMDAVMPESGAMAGMLTSSTITAVIVEEIIMMMIIMSSTQHHSSSSASNSQSGGSSF